MVPFGRAIASGDHKRVVAVTAAQSGKALALDTPIATPSGWASMGDLRPGDVVFGAQGQPVSVVYASPIMVGRRCYEVVFDDGEVIVADADHKWTLERQDGSGRRRRVETLTTDEMLRVGVSRAQSNGRNRFTFAVPLAGALDLPDRDLPVDPYVLGVWLGDGNSRAASLSVGDQDLDEMRRLLGACGLETGATRERTCWRVASWKPGERTRGRGIRAGLRSLGLIANKHIPPAYLRASTAQRLALLQGLMDTDGGAESGSVASFCSAGPDLAGQVHELAASLGYRPRVRQHTRGHWRVDVQCYRETTVFRLPRKTAALRSRSDAGARPFRNARRSIVAIRETASVPVRCIGVDAGDHLYLAGRAMIPTHNTDTMLDVMGHRLDQRPAPILYVGPSLEFNTGQFEPRLMELLDQAAALAHKVVRGRRMRQTLKTIAGVRVRLAHAGSSTALKSDPASLALVDEYDEMTANVRGQGDVLGLVEARGDTYTDFCCAITSTTSRGRAETEIDPVSGLEFWKPGDPEDIESRIWRLWQEGTRYHWAWACPHCGEYFIPRMKHLKTREEHPTPAQARKSAFLCCPVNGCVIEDDEKAGMNATGVMVAPGQRIEGGRVVGAPPDATTVSFWTSGLASPFVTWGERMERLISARLSGDPDRIQTAVNAQFGELYVPFEAGDLPSTEELMARRLPYKTGDHLPEVLRIVAGVDVQKNSLYYVVRGFGGRSTSWLMQYGQIFGPTAEDEVWEELADLLLTPVDGLPIERMLIDSGFRPDKPEAGDIHKVYEFARRYPRLAVPCKGQATQSVPIRFNEIEVTPRGKKAPISIRLAHIDSDFFKSLVHSRLRIPTDRPGALQIPMDATEDYARQLVSEVRIVTRGERPEWVVLRKDNHYLDAEALAAAGGYLLNTQRIPEGVAREGGAPGQTPPDPDPSPASAPDVGPEADQGAAGAPPRRAAPAHPPVQSGGGGGGSLRERMANRARGLR